MGIKICIVLYNCDFDRSKAVLSLNKSKESLGNTCINIYLNGKCRQDNVESPPQFNIIDNHGENLYLLDNYRACLKQAVVENSEWIVFFDQDTEITQEYLIELNNLSNLDKDCVASFPILKAQTICFTQNPFPRYTFSI